MGYHSPLSPSGADKYLLCPDSVVAEEGLPDETSKFAAEGSVLHEIAEICLLTGGHPSVFVGKEMEEDGYTFTITEDHAKCMVDNLDWLRAELADGRMIVEKRVNLDWPLRPGESGTADVIGLTYDEVIICADWKFGMGEPVDPVENRQAKLYSIGAIQQYFPQYIDKPETKVRIVIMQPRIEGHNRLIWETTVGDLWRWGEEIHPLVQKLGQKGLPRVAGRKQCLWCKARKAANGGCYAYDEFMASQFMSCFSDITEATENDETLPIKNPRALTNAERAHILQHADLIRDFLADIHEWALKTALKGVEEVPGFELSKGRAPARKWKEPDTDKVMVRLAAYLGTMAFKDPDIISPAQAEKMIGKAEFARLLGSFIEQGEPKTVLVQAGSARERVSSVKELFSQLD